MFHSTWQSSLFSIPHFQEHWDVKLCLIDWVLALLALNNPYDTCLCFQPGEGQVEPSKNNQWFFDKYSTVCPYNIPMLKRMCYGRNLVRSSLCISVHVFTKWFKCVLHHLFGIRAKCVELLFRSNSYQVTLKWLLMSWQITTPAEMMSSVEHAKQLSSYLGLASFVEEK